MSVIIAKCKSKKGNTYVCLRVNQVIVTFDIMTICRVANISPNVLENMGVGDVIDITKLS